MLNKLIRQFLCSAKSSYKSILPVLLLSLMISACSVTQENAHTGNKQLSTETNKIYLDAIKQMKAGNTKKAQILLSKVSSNNPVFQMHK